MGDRDPFLSALNEMQDKYEFIEEIGGGSFGLVYKACKLSGGGIVAVKLVRIPDEGVPSSLIEDIAFVKDLHHENIIRLLENWSIQKYMFLVFEYFNFELFNYMMVAFPSKAKDPQRIKNFLFQILSGVAYYHSLKTIHLDLKPAKLRISRFNDVVKIADYGWPCGIGAPSNTYTTEVVNTGYKAPELLFDNRDSTPADVWSVGVIFAEMLIRQNMFCGVTLDQLSKVLRCETWRELDALAKELPGPDQGRVDLLARILHLNPDERITPEDALNQPPGLDQDGVDLLAEMLRLNPDERITAKKALKHDYFRDVRNAP